MRTLLAITFFALFGTYALGRLGWIEGALPETPRVQHVASPPPAKTERFTDRIAHRHVVKQEPL